MDAKKKEILTLFKNKKYRLTNIRESIIDIFIEKNHINFNHVVEILKKKYGSNISIMSVYNTIDLLVAEHIIFTNSFDGKQIWYDFIDNPSVHLVCDSCQKIKHIDNLNVDHKKIVNNLSPILEASKWRPIHYKIECHGICDNCISSKIDKHNHLKSDLD